MHLQPGIRWHFAPAWPVGLGLPSPGWEMEPVKLAPHRDVFRARIDGHDLHVKHYRPDGREMLRSLVRPPKACSEFTLGLELLRRGVPTLEPLAWGRHGLHGWLVTRTLPDAVTLLDWLETRPPLNGLAEAVGRFLAKCHASGVRHDDLHPGNLLLRAGELYLIDLAMCRVGAPLDWRASRENLIVLDRWFAMRFSRQDRLRAWKAYLAARQLQLDAHHEARSLANATARSLLRFTRVLDGASRGKGRHLRRIPGGLAVADVPRDALEEIIARPDAIIEASRVLKRSRSSAVVETVLDGRPVILKRVDATRWTDPLAALVRPAPALHAWRMGHALGLRGLATPCPLAVWHRTALGLPATGYLLMEKVPDAVDLLAWVRKHGVSRDLAFAVGRMVRRLHGWEMSHRDLKAANVLVSPAGAVMGTRRLVPAPPDGGDHVWLCDLAGLRHCPGIGFERRVRDLARLNASFLTERGVSLSDRLRVLLAYRNEALAGRERWKGWWRAIAAASQAKREANIRRGRALG